MDYKLSIHGANFYKEVNLTKDWSKGLNIGTRKECQLRFSKETFVQDFLVRIIPEGGQWKAICEGSAVIQKQNCPKENSGYLTLRERMTFCDSENNCEFFSVDFSVDFVNKTMDFDKSISCKDCNEVLVGGTEKCSIRIKDPVLANDYIKFTRSENGWNIDIENARYGILLNGFPNRSKSIQLREKDIISFNGYSFFWKEQKLFISADTEVETELPIQIKLWQINSLQYPKFVRSARQQFIVPKEKIDILPPKNKEEPTKKNLIMSILPMIISMGMIAMMRMTMGGNVLFLVMSVGMCSVSAIIGIINYKNEEKQYKKNAVKRENDYNRYIAQQEQKIQELQDKESFISAQKYPTIEEELRFVDDFDARLFEKQRSHEDYLFIRLGQGVVKSQCEVSFRKQEYREVDDPLMDYPELLHEKYRDIANMPVVLDLSRVNAVGFLGDRTHLYQMTKNLILEFCIEHYYQDVRLYLLMDKDDKSYFEWARWFRNFSSENGMRNFGYDESSGKNLLEYLYSQLSERAKLKESDIRKLPTNVVFIYRSDLLGEHPISNYLENASKLGFVFLFFEEYTEKLNPYCRKRIFLSAETHCGYIQDIEDGEQIQHFSYSRVPMQRAKEIAEKMACVYVDEVSLEASLTKNITLYELLGIRNVYDLNLKKRWQKSRIYDTMAAPLGVKSGDEIVYLDLHEKYHGPHGLVAGTTGSGKSEILQSYILSMSTLFHPYEVGFIIIDFKGGGMVNQFRKLPHLNGAITNIDGKEIERSLLSIKAELRKRQKIFAEYNVNHIDDYIRQYKGGYASKPLPHLILIVDEFAELKSEQPEFMKELISTARIGRSLGVHLILATQKPSGVVNEQIWSNSKFKLCLKVQNQGDSNEVLKSPLAAEIREPGRAYLQVGNNEIFQLFQSAYSGAPVPNGAMGEIKSFKIFKVDLAGRREVIYEQKPAEDKGGDTQLDAIVDYVEEYCTNSGIERLPNICLPPLLEKIPYAIENDKQDKSSVSVPVGIYDDPNNQYQGVFDIRLSQGNTFIVGSSQMGKTNFLQTIIRGVAQQYSSNEVQMYLLDFASMILKNFGSLKHVGDVITYAEEDKLKNFFKRMEEELINRKKVLAGMGLSSYTAYKEAGEMGMPQIIVMIDNIGGFREMFSSLDDKLLKLVREGASLGLCFVITGRQTVNLSYRYLSNFSNRFALYCNDSGEYASLLERCRSNLGEIPGRCLFSLNKNIYEGQIYLAFHAEKEIDKIKEIRSFIQEVNEKDRGLGASKTPSVPEVLTEKIIDELMSDDGKRKSYSVPIGMCYENMEIDYIIMSNFQMYGVSGPKESSKNKFISYCIEKLLQNQEKAPVRIHIFDSPERELEEFSNRVTFYDTDVDSIDACLRELYKKIKMRKGQNLDAEPLEYIVINNKAVYEKIGKEEELLTICKNCLTEYRDCKYTIALTDVANENLMLKKCEFEALLKGIMNLFIFDSASNIKLFDLTTKQKQKFKKPLLKDEMYFKCGDYFEKYKIPNRD